jgi:hypothetical protein
MTGGSKVFKSGECRGRQQAGLLDGKPIPAWQKPRSPSSITAKKPPVIVVMNPRGR